MHFPTPIERLCDERGRPSFLWDNDLTVDELRTRLADENPDMAAYWLGTTMRQARPDDALELAMWSNLDPAPLVEVQQRLVERLVRP